jgi:hypothetical protein
VRLRRDVGDREETRKKEEGGKEGVRLQEEVQEIVEKERRWRKANFTGR